METIVRKATKIIRKTCWPETLRAMPLNSMMTFDCAEHGRMTSAISAMYRLNNMKGLREYEIETNDGGATFNIIRYANPLPLC